MELGCAGSRVLSGALVGVAAQDRATIPHCTLTSWDRVGRVHQHYPVASGGGRQRFFKAHKRYAAHLVLPRWQDFLTTSSRPSTDAVGKSHAARTDAAREQLNSRRKVLDPT